jgi:hypothetical protein
VDDFGAVGPVVVRVGGVVVDDDYVDGAGGLEEGPDGVVLVGWVGSWLAGVFSYWGAKGRGGGWMGGYYIVLRRRGRARLLATPWEILGCS